MPAVPEQSAGIGSLPYDPYGVYPEWTKQGVKEHKLEDGTSIYVTQDGEEFWGMEDAQEHILQSYWDPAELDMPQVIKDLEGTNVKDYGAIPSYLLDKNVDLMDSSTWNTASENVHGVTPPLNPDDSTYVAPADAEKMISSNMNELEALDYIEREARGHRDPEFLREHLMDMMFPKPLPTNEEGVPYQWKTLPAGEIDPGPWNAMGKEGHRYKDYPYQPFGPWTHHERTFPVNEYENILDFYARQGNPELKRGSSTGFFPTKYYPQAGIDALQDILDKGNLFQRYTDKDSAGHYTWDDQIGFDWMDMYDTYDEKMRKVPPYLNRQFLNEVAGHEGIHYNMYPHVRGSKAIEHSLPYPENAFNQNKWQKAMGHPAMHYIDNLFFPSTRQDVSVNKEGWDNVQAIMNWEPSTPTPVQMGGNLGEFSSPKIDPVAPPQPNPHGGW